jgi:immune inhibitor A
LNTDNADDWHPCVRLIQADGAEELQHGYGSGDSADVFGDNRNFNDNSNPSANLYDGSDSGVQLTILDVNSGSDYAEIHFGEFTSWF